jgi:hypothetical protein
LLDKGQHDGQTWEGFLHTSGEELELNKCFYYLLSWKWDWFGTPSPQTIEEQKIKKLEIKMSSTKKDYEARTERS